MASNVILVYSRVPVPNPNIPCTNYQDQTWSVQSVEKFADSVSNFGGFGLVLRILLQEARQLHQLRFRCLL